MGVFASEKAEGESWECSGRRESSGGNADAGFVFHQTSADLRKMMGHVREPGRRCHDGSKSY